MAEEIIEREVLVIQEALSKAKYDQNNLLTYANKIYGIADRAIDNSEAKSKIIELKNQIIQEKNAEITRLKQPWWKRVL